MAEILKAHGSRNDIFLTALTPRDFRTDVDLREFVRALCERSNPLGGGDGIYFHDAGTLQAWFVNPDGSPAEFCGNGMRCLGRLVLECRGAETAVIRSGGTEYTVRRGRPTDEGVQRVCVEHPGVTFLGGSDPAVTELTVPNPHLVTVADKYLESELAAMAAQRPDTNVSVLVPVAADHIFVRTFERGAGLTASCGSGMVAARAVYSRLGYVPQDMPVTIHNVGGAATASLRDWRPVLEGNATYVYRADVDPAAPLPPAVATETFDAELAAYDRFDHNNDIWLSSQAIFA